MPMASAATGAGKAPSVLAKELLTSKEVIVRMDAADALKKLGQGAASEEQALVQALQEDAHAGVRMAAACALGQLGQGASAEAVKGLAEALRKEGEPGARSVIGRALALLGGPLGEDASAVAERALATALGKEPEIWVRRNLVMWLGLLGSGAANEALPALRGCLAKAEEDGEVVLEAAKAIQRLKPGDEDVLPALVRSLTSASKSMVRLFAAQALAKLGEGAASEVLEPLVDALVKASAEEREERVWSTIADALGQLGRGQYVKPRDWPRVALKPEDEQRRSAWRLAYTLNESDYPQLRRDAAEDLERMLPDLDVGVWYKTVKPLLEECALHHKDRTTREAAQKVLDTWDAWGWREQPSSYSRGAAAEAARGGLAAAP